MVPNDQTIPFNEPFTVGSPWMPEWGYTPGSPYQSGGVTLIWPPETNYWIQQDEAKPQLWFTCGCARSGKSTYARQWMRSEVTPPGGYYGPRAVWCADSLRKVVTGERYNRYAEPFIHMMKGYAVGALLHAGHSVLCDGTHTTRESIKNILRINIDAKPILFETSAEICKERAIATNQPDLLPVIDRHWRELQELLSAGIEKVMEELRAEVTGRYPDE